MTTSQRKAQARHDTLRFRIWQYANPIGWNCTIKQIAEALDVSTRAVVNCARVHPSWLGRMRADGNNLDDGWGKIGGSHALARHLAAHLSGTDRPGIEEDA